MKIVCYIEDKFDSQPSCRIKKNKQLYDRHSDNMHHQYYCEHRRRTRTNKKVLKTVYKIEEHLNLNINLDSTIIRVTRLIVYTSSK